MPDRPADEGTPAGRALPLLSVKGLGVAYPAATDAVRRVDLELNPGEVLGLSGPSGAGKSLTAGAICGSTGRGDGASVSGSITLRGEELVGLDEARMRSIRGDVIGTIFQRPGSALNPMLTVGSQITETMAVNDHVPRDARKRRALDLLSEAGVRDPERVAAGYSHELSGGTKQRAMIALALCRDPEVLIADEPVSSLDPGSADEILELIDGLRRSRGLAVLLISHDLTTIARVADRIAIMDRGRIVESGPAGKLVAAPQSPIARELVAAGVEHASSGRDKPADDRAPERDAPMVTLLDIEVTYRTGRANGENRVLDGASLDITRGESLGLMGPTGAGKSTLARCLLRIQRPDSGRVLVDGLDVTGVPERRLRNDGPPMTMVFQDPASSLNPRRSVLKTVQEPLLIRGAKKLESAERAATMLDRVGLGPTFFDRRPGELSGGQQQRVAIARALIADPRVVVFDEPFSSLDTLNRVRIVDLLQELRYETGITSLFISHDHHALNRLADRKVQLVRGRIVAA